MGRVEPVIKSAAQRDSQTRVTLTLSRNRDPRMGLSFHILRHSYGSALAMNGVPMAVIAAALGHSDTRMTEKHYAALAPSYVADAIRANLPPLNIVNPDSITPLRQRR